MLIMVVECDVEVFEVFYVLEVGFWDGWFFLGGVWVVYLDVMEFEWVIIKNKVNGKFVIGVFFWCECVILGLCV